jgi:hypothetical protein
VCLLCDLIDVWGSWLAPMLLLFLGKRIAFVFVSVADYVARGTN